MIPFNRATVAPRQLEYVNEAFSRGHVAGDGPFGRKAEKLLEAATGAHRALLGTSCTHALEMSALLLDLKPGDEVIVPAFTFVSTINAFALRGAQPVFCDIRPDTLNLDEGLLEAHLTPRTKAIVPVHYAGVGCEMDRILAVARARGIAVIEDNAHGLFGAYRGKPLGSFGAMATQSFHETKNFSCGEGGALLLNDASFVERAEILREKGTNRSKFFRGQVDKYTWVDLGSSWVLSDVLGATLVAQLEARETIQARRRRIWERYAEGLADWARAHDVALPHVPPHCETDRAHRCAREEGHQGGVPLPAAPSLADGGAARNELGGVPGDRAHRRLSRATPVLCGPFRGRSGPRYRGAARISLVRIPGGCV
jgi:dTDP-4-amino-4,6-dideoxygalactose transaminase